MRCAYCGGLNQERAAFCTSCGRDLRYTSAPRPTSAGQPRPQAGQAPRAAPPVAPAFPAPANGPEARTAAARTARQARTPAAPPNLTPVVAPAPIEPEAPGPFPPKSMQDLTLLLTGAQPYTVLDDSVESGQKRLVRISYASCAGWQQVATLLRALRDLAQERNQRIVIQGVQAGRAEVYTFTNGQLQFDRAVRLGSQVNRRYIFETGNGMANDTVRFVLNE